jgi:hypothetical protein
MPLRRGEWRVCGRGGRPPPSHPFTEPHPVVYEKSMFILQALIFHLPKFHPSKVSFGLLILAHFYWIISVLPNNFIGTCCTVFFFLCSLLNVGACVCHIACGGQVEWTTLV